MEALQNLDYPSEKEDWLLDVLIGGLICMVPIFNFVAMGYIMDALEIGIRNVRELPAWDNMGDKFGRGFWFFVISLVYVIIPLMVFLVFLLPLIVEAARTGDVSTISGVVAAAGGLIYCLLTILAAGMIPMAATRWIYTGSVGAAFDVRAIFADIRLVPGDYIVAVLLFIFLGGLLFTLVSWVPVVNLMVYFYWTVAFYNYFGQLYGRVAAKLVI